MKTGQLEIRLYINPDREPSLYHALVTVKPRHRAELVRYYAKSGLGGISVQQPMPAQVAQAPPASKVLAAKKPLQDQGKVVGAIMEASQFGIFDEEEDAA